MSWSTVDHNKLAVATSDNTIHILHHDNGFTKVGELIGHQSVVTFVSWSGKSENKLVSTSFDHTVRVWDTQTMDCIAWSEYENKMQCAAFLPTGKLQQQQQFKMLYLHLKVFHVRFFFFR